VNTLTEIARRNGLDLDRLQMLDGLGRLPQPTGANSYGRLYDERGVLAVIMPGVAPSDDSAALETRAQQERAAILSFIFDAPTEKARRVRLAVMDYDRKPEEQKPEVADLARRCECSRNYFYDVLESWRGLHMHAGFSKDSAR